MRSHIIVVLGLLIGTSARAQWTPNGLLVAGPDLQMFPAIVEDGYGGAVVAWSDLRHGTLDIFAQRLSRHGIPQWSADGAPVALTIGTQERPVIVSDPSGGAIIAWSDHRNGNYDIYIQRLNGLGNPLWTFNGVAVCLATGDQFIPALAYDGDEGAIVAWYDDRSGPYDIYAQRIDWGGDLQWAVDGVLVSGAPHIQERPVIVSDGNGGAVIAWSDARIGIWSDIYAQRVNASGQTQWLGDGVALCTAVNRQERLKIASDGFGGAIVVWRDVRTGQGDIYAQRVSGSGIPQWSLNGVSICSAANAQDSPAIIADGAGGAFIAWYDGRNGDLDVYTQRLTASGVPLWTVDGVALTTSLGEQSDPALATDGNGGAIVTWQDLRGGRYDLYAQRIDGAGIQQWTANGVAVCTASWDQTEPVMVSDGAGGAMIAWEDRRAGIDVYAWRIGHDGAPTGIDARSAPSRMFVSSFPNPFGSATSIDVENPADGEVDISVFDVTGRRVRTLWNDSFTVGKRQLDFDGRDDSGRFLPSGVYFIRAVSSDGIVAHKIVLTR